MENNTNPTPETHPESVSPVNSPTPPPGSVQPTPVTPPKKSKKKLVLIVVLVILLLAAIAVGVWSYLNKNTMPTPQPAPTTSVTHEIPHFKDLYYTNKTVIAVDSDGKKEELFKIDKEGLQPLRVVERESKPWLIYATGTKIDESNNYLTDYKTIEMTDGAKTVVVTTFTNTNRPTEITKSVSPDGTKLAYYRTEADGFSKPTIYMLDLKEGAVPSVLLNDATPDKHQVAIKGWSADNKKVFLQQLTCRQCDGPALPIIYSLDVAAKTASKLYSAPLTGSTIGSVVVLPSGKQAIVNAGQYSGLGIEYEQNLKSTYEVYLVDLEKGQGETILKKGEQAEIDAKPVGWNPDVSELYFSVTHATKPSNPDDFAGEMFSHLLRYNIAKKSSTKLTLSLSMLQQNGANLVSANANGEHVAISTSSYTNDSSNYALQLLHLGEDENEVMPLVNSSTNGIVSLGFYNNMK